MFKHVMSPFLIMKLKIEESENINDPPNYIPTNIFDPSQWKTIDIKLRDLLVEKAPFKAFAQGPQIC